MRILSIAMITPLLLGGPIGALNLALDQPAYEEPSQPWPSVDDAEQAGECRDRVEQVRAEAGKPRLERGPADPDAPLMIHAVDRRIDGCGVLVPVADPADIRQAPEFGRPELIPER